MNGFFAGTIVLVLALIVAASFQVAAIYGTMWCLHKYAGDKIHEHTYGQFDFNNFQKPQLSELLVRLAAIYFTPTILFHLLEYWIVGPYIKLYWAIVLLVLMVLETATVAVGLHFIIKLDRKRLIILTAASAVIYLLIYWLFISRNLV